MMSLPSTAHDDSAEAFSYSGMELEAMGEAENYCRWIIRQFAPFVGNEILEVGAGVGTFAGHLLSAFPSSQHRITLLEPAENLFPVLEQRFRENPRATVRQGTLEAHAGVLMPDTAIMVNVLEHVEDDSACLSLLRSILQPGGHLLLLAPALSWEYGSLDAAFGHFRRYNRRELEKKLREGGFEIRKIRYMNLPGVAAWYLAGKILRQKTLRPAAVRFYDRWVIRPWSRCEDIWNPPLGQNLLAVARK
jgi:2-polyprenyl-3-methyl-5-hydroxy-6-metoxy-1,4-benzoquinol methylase